WIKTREKIQLGILFQKAYGFV
ncbi:uncharacterized protein METZ01_LOCUS407435, partial [marine metagenome]